MGGETYQVYGYGFVIETSEVTGSLKNEDVEMLRERGYSSRQIMELDKFLVNYDEDENFTKEYDIIIKKYQEENSPDECDIYRNRNCNEVYMVYSKYTHAPLGLDEFLEHRTKHEGGELIGKMDALAQKLDKTPQWFVCIANTTLTKFLQGRMNVISTNVSKVDGRFGGYHEKTVERVVEVSGVQYTVEYTRAEYSNNFVDDIVIQIKINEKKVLYFSYYFEEYIQTVEPEYYKSSSLTLKQIEKICGEDLSEISEIVF